MPTYTFKVLEKLESHPNFEVGDIIDLTIKISEYDAFKADHPQLERYFEEAPAFTYNGRTFGSLRAQTDDTFKERMAKIAEAHPGSPLADEFGGPKSVKTVKTEQLIKKHNERK